MAASRVTAPPLRSGPARCSAAAASARPASQSRRGGGRQQEEKARLEQARPAHARRRRGVGGLSVIITGVMGGDWLAWNDLGPSLSDWRAARARHGRESDAVSDAAPAPPEVAGTLSGNMAMWVVASPEGRLSCSMSWPGRLHLSRSLAIAGRIVSCRMDSDIESLMSPCAAVSRSEGVCRPRRACPRRPSCRLPRKYGNMGR